MCCHCCGRPCQPLSRHVSADARLGFMGCTGCSFLPVDCEATMRGRTCCWHECATYPVCCKKCATYTMCCTTGCCGCYESQLTDGGRSVQLQQGVHRCSQKHHCGHRGQQEQRGVRCSGLCCAVSLCGEQHAGKLTAVSPAIMPKGVSAGGACCCRSPEPFHRAAPHFPGKQGQGLSQ